MSVLNNLILLRHPVLFELFRINKREAQATPGFVLSSH